MPRRKGREGVTGTQDLYVRRMVQRGGRVRYRREWWAHPLLADRVGQEILVHDFAFLGTIDLWECWYPMGTNRRAFRFLPKNRRLWQIGALIAQDVPPEQDGSL